MCVEGIRRSGAVDGGATNAGEGRRVQRDVLIERRSHGGSNEKISFQAEAVGYVH